MRRTLIQEKGDKRQARREFRWILGGAAPGAIHGSIADARLHFRGNDGRSFVEQGARRTVTRYLALVGALQLFFRLSFSLPSLWSGLHSDRWVDNMPSYFTAMYPEYAAQPDTCGGPGIPAYRPPQICLPAR